jgi:cyclic beta-1,2-glucan synthetase
LRLHNYWQRPRRITVTYYAEWVLGLQRGRSSPHIVSTLDDDDGAMYAWNTFERNGSRTAFLTSNLPVHGTTTSRREFLGTKGDSSYPAAMYRAGLSGEVAPAADPCAALQVHLDIEPGATAEVHFVLGQGRDLVQARELAGRYRTTEEAHASLARVHAHWHTRLDGLQVTTPDAAVDLVTNGWLLYQALSCRLWGRTALYQSGGAFGFRDQLQDAMAFTASSPELTREQIIRAASVQFYRGDVLHWWHNEPLRGVRTRCSDDMLWLPYVAAHYVSTTGDTSVLDERVAYLDGQLLAPEESERYAEFSPTHIAESVYDHCIQAIEHAAAKTGPHGLPLIGSGDWNDGLNRVGSRGHGESIWLGWFLVVVFRDFATVCDHRGNNDVASDYRARADALAEQIDAVAWDGQWYLRAYDDDGHPVGSASNEECKIDLNAQTWSVLAEAPDPLHRMEAMRSAERWLMDDRHVLRLLTPPFEHGDSDPGYIKGYPPGVRENGAQYSHAAAWAGFAYTALGDGNRALDVLRCLNPINHADSPAAAANYRVEPYAVAADIYAEAPYFGRGGWTWYTGAAAWTHRLIVEGILGIRRRGDVLEISPCLPDKWDSYQARLRLGENEYLIKVVHAGPREYRVYENGVLIPDGRLAVNPPSARAGG